MRPHSSLRSLPKLLAACFFLAAPLLRAQGSLSPPAGPPAPVMKTLDQVEPRIPVESLGGIPNEAKYLINKPGSYYLAGNVTGLPAVSGIEVTTAGVTIDLNGFYLRGGPASNSGIVAVGGRLIVRNGFLCDWGSHGILAQEDTLLIENITAEGNGGVGIDVTGNNNTIRDCLADGNAFGGFNCLGESYIEGCQANSNTGWGVRFDNASGRIERSTFAGNTANGILQVGTGSLRIAGNAVRQNHLAGIVVEADAQVLDNSVVGNGASGSAATAAGIYLDGASNRVEGNSLSGNKTGIFAADAGGEAVVHNVVIHSTSGQANNYVGSGGANAASFGPVATTAAAMTTPAHNLSLP